MSLKLLLFSFLFFHSSFYCEGLYKRYLVRMKKVANPRSPDRNLNPIQVLKSNGKNSLRPLFSEVEKTLRPKPSGPGSPSSSLIKSISELWLVNAASIICQPSYIERLKEIDAVEEIFPDEIIDISLGQSASAQKSELLDREGVQAFHNSGIVGERIRIGILDTGIVDHETFSGRIKAYKDFTAVPSEKMIDPVGHGTHVAAILAGASFKGEVLGMAPYSSLMVARVLEPISKEGNEQEVSRRVQAFASRILNAMQWIIDPDGDPETNDMPHVINNSWGFPKQLPVSHTMFEEVLSRWSDLGIITVFAAGNDGKSGENSVLFPGTLSQVITVGATHGTKRAYFSGIGSSELAKPDFVAPGHRVYSLKRYGNSFLLGPMSGTSMAAPFVSGLIALMKNYDPFLDQKGAYELLKKASLDLGKTGWDVEHGWGFIQPKELKKILQDDLRKRLSEGGRAGFVYYKHFYGVWLKNRDPKTLDRLIEAELGMMAFVERQFESGGNSQAVLDLWLRELERIAKSEPEPFASLYQRILKRTRFLTITNHESELDED